MLQVNIKANTSTMRKTHYDTLKVSPQATHNEIKSAYYKLTVQYHPDKNKSESAKQIFQEIADAYEVLGNYQSRKQYDRSIVIRYKNINQMQRPQNTYTSATAGKVYNFDVWTRTHYHYSFVMYQKKRDAYKRFIKSQEVANKRQQSNYKSTIFLIITSVLYLIFVQQLYKNNDIPLDKKKS